MKTILRHWLIVSILTLSVSVAVGQCGTCENETGELIANWNFAQGDAGFYSDYNGNPNPGPGLPPLWDPATYQVGNDAGDFHWDFEGLAYSPFPFFGNFMVVNGSDIEGLNIWCQDVDVVPGGQYDFSMWVQSVVVQNPANLQVEINGQSVGPVFDAPTNLNNWQQHAFNWIAPAGVFSATICITNVNVINGGNDFGLDAISFSGCEPITIENVADAGPDMTICSGETVQLGTAAAANINYSWNPSPYLDDITIANPNATINSASDVAEEYEFVVVSDSSNLGCTSTDTVIVTVLPQPEIFMATDTAVCSFPVTLDVGLPGADYSWSTLETSQSISVDAPGIYSVDVDLDGCVVSGETEVTLVDFENVDLGNDQVVCVLPITLDATIAGAIYEWNTSEVSPTIEADTPGIYSVTATHNGCESYDEIEIIVDNYLTFDLGADLDVCEFPVEVTAPIDGADYSWSNGDDQATTSVDEPGWTVLEIDQDGCTGSDSILVTLVDYETVDLGSDQTVCELPITLTSNIVAETYDWSTDENTASIQVNNPGTYSLIAVQNGCPSSDDVTIVVDNEIPLDLGPDTTVCELPITLESPVDNVNYDWSDGTDNNSITIEEPGMVELTIEQNGCMGTDQINVVLFEHDDPNIPDTLESCLSPVSVSTDLQNADWTWSTGDESPTTSTDQTGWLYLNFTQNNCPAIDSTFVLIDNVFQFDMDETASTCDFPFTFDSGVVADNYSWSNGDVSPETTVSTPGTYILTAETDGCEGSQSVTIAAIPHQTAQLPDTIEVCAFPYSLSAGVEGAEIYSWSTGENIEVIEVNIVGDYVVEIIDNGCPSSDETRVVQLPTPSIELSESFITICDEEQARIDADVQYEDALAWSHGPTTAEIVVSEAGIYVIEASNDCGTEVKFVEVELEDCAHYLFIPNAFSPNEDGINDMFEVHAVNFSDAEIWIYARNGQLVYYTSDVLTENWNGAVEGSSFYSMPTVLVYQFRGKTIQGKVVEKNGTITVVR